MPEQPVVIENETRTSPLIFAASKGMVVVVVAQIKMRITSLMFGVRDGDGAIGNVVVIEGWGCIPCGCPTTWASWCWPPLICCCHCVLPSLSLWSPHPSFTMTEGVGGVVIVIT